MDGAGGLVPLGDMASCRLAPLAGYDVHGFYSAAELNVQKLVEEAKHRWFRANEIYAILANQSWFKPCAQPVMAPASGTVILYDRKIVRNFRKDGHHWKKKKDGKTIQEAHEKLKIGDKERIHVYYARGEDDPFFYRRCYWLLDKNFERMVFVHYRQVSEENTAEVPNTEAVEAEPLKNVHVSSSPVTSVGSSTMHSATHLGETSLLEYDTCGAELLENSTDGLEKFWEDLYMSSLDKSPLLADDPITSSHDILEESSLNCGINSILSSSDNQAEDFASFQQGGRFVKNASYTDHQTNQFYPNGTYSNGAGLMLSSVDLSEDRSRLSSLMNDNTSDFLASQMFDGSRRVESHTMKRHIFDIVDVSPLWAYSTDETKVLVVGSFTEQHQISDASSLFCVFGTQYTYAEMVQYGVYRCIAMPQSPGSVKFYMSLDGRTPISQILSFEYRQKPNNETDSQVDMENNDRKMKLQLQTRLAHLLFPKHINKASPNSKLASISLEKEWKALVKSVNDGKTPFISATDRLLEMFLRNKLRELLLHSGNDGTTVSKLDEQGQGIIHLCACLDYPWAVHYYMLSGTSLDFRDANGWTALHWAAHFGREKAVAALLYAGANPCLVTDPTPEFPGGCTAADLAAKQEYEGLAAYLAEKGLTSHLRAMSLSGAAESTTLNLFRTISNKYNNLSEQELCLKESLAAYRTAADAASSIQTALRERALKIQTKVVQAANSEIAAEIVAAMKIQNAYRNHKRTVRMKAAARIQSHFLTWQYRKNFLNMKKNAIKIQAAFRGYQARKQYHKIIWSTGVLEKAILRWRKKRKGLRGINADGMYLENVNATMEEDFYRISREQAEERHARAVTRVQALFRSYRAQKEYRQMKLAFEEAKHEFNQLNQETS